MPNTPRVPCHPYFKLRRLTPHFQLGPQALGSRCPSHPEAIQIYRKCHSERRAVGAPRSGVSGAKEPAFLRTFSRVPPPTPQTQISPEGITLGANLDQKDREKTTLLVGVSFRPRSGTYAGSSRRTHQCNIGKVLLDSLPGQRPGSWLAKYIQPRQKANLTKVTSIQPFGFAKELCKPLPNRGSIVS